MTAGSGRVGEGRSRVGDRVAEPAPKPSTELHERRNRVARVADTGTPPASSAALSKKKKRDTTQKKLPAAATLPTLPPVGVGGLTPHAWLHELLDLVGSGPSGVALRQCPAHRDTAPSLSIGVGVDGRVLLHCYAGCLVQEVLTALNMTWRHLHAAPWVMPLLHHRTWGPAAWPTFPPVQIRGGHPAGAGMKLVATHLYGDGRWSLERWRHPITGSKDLRWLTRDDRGAYIPGLRGVPTAGLPLYEERQIRMAIGAGEPVVLVESESSVDALGAVGLYATTWAGGAASPPLGQLCTVLAGADVVLVPDHDEPGLACAARIAEALTAVAQLHVALPPVGQDARDLLASRGPAAFDPNTLR